MMTMLLPIPAKKESIEFYFVPYDLNKKGYVNYKGMVSIRGSDSVMQFRREVYETYGVDVSSYTITKVNNNEFSRYFST
jgi:hypothetical protein